MNWLSDVIDVPPLSFVFAGKKSSELLPGWRRESSDGPAVTGRLRHVTWTDPATGLQVAAHVRTFPDFPAIDWVIEFKNTGSQDTPILEQILPMDLRLPMEAADRVRLHHANGSLCQIDDFLPRLTELKPGRPLALAPQGGRSSDGAFPFMNLQRPGGGFVLAVGWSGQWTARFERDKQALRIAAGMEQTHLRLHPGERIRTPRILLLPWEGSNPTAGNNQLRQLLLAHYLPRIDGELVTPPIAQCLQAYYYQTGQAGEQYEREALPKAASLGTEVYWIDACWYGRSGREWWQEVGSWVINRERFPNGLKPIADAAQKAGMKFILWFEPERVRAGSVLHEQHPQFLLASPHDKDNFLLNLGNPGARRHITDLVSGLIDEIGIDIYRQDFNFRPLPYWQAADATDRVGITEIQHVMGHYEFWDELRRRHPNLWIDNCASGGRRIDLETLSRSLPLWPSDFLDVVGLDHGMDLHVGNQCIHAGLARWVPLFAGGLWNFTPYSSRSGGLGSFTYGFHVPFDQYAREDDAAAPDFKKVLGRGRTLLDDDFPMDQARLAIAECKDLRPFLTGNFHLLLPLTVSGHDWCAYQLHRPDMHAGFAVFLRRHRSPFPTMQAALKQIDPAAEYRVSLSPDYHPQPEQRMTGRQLEALTITIPNAPGSALLRYRLP
jgi:alpha-galactosidase